MSDVMQAIRAAYGIPEPASYEQRDVLAGVLLTLGAVGIIGVAAAAFRWARGR